MQSFKAWFHDWSDHFVIIGGAACSLILSEDDTPFRPTKDIDVVLLIEAMNADFGRRFWEYILEAGYEHKQKSSGKPQFYRFYAPKNHGYPEMVELFSRHIDGLTLPADAVITPIPIGEDISSLSAILLSDDYYDFLVSGIRRIDGLPVLDEIHLIPFKAKAWLELTVRRSESGGVDLNDIRKHKRDIYQMAAHIPPGFKMKLPDVVQADMRKFILAVQERLPNTPRKERAAEKVRIESIVSFFGIPVDSN
jgi:hypothetical protein